LWLLDVVNRTCQGYYPTLMELADVDVDGLPPPPILSFDEGLGAASGDAAGALRRAGTSTARGPGSARAEGEAGAGGGASQRAWDAHLSEPEERAVLFRDTGPLGFDIGIEPRPGRSDGEHALVVTRVTNPRVANRGKGAACLRVGAEVVACGKGPQGAIRFEMKPRVRGGQSAKSVLASKIALIKKVGRPLVLWVRPPLGKTPPRGTFEVQFTEPSIGLMVRRRPDVDRGAVVTGFKAGGEKGPAERCGRIHEGQLLVAINGQTTLGLDFKGTVALFKASIARPGRPMVLRFAWNPDFSVTLQKPKARARSIDATSQDAGPADAGPADAGPADAVDARASGSDVGRREGGSSSTRGVGLRVAELNGFVVVTGFARSPGAAERSGRVHAGQVLVEVAGRSTAGVPFGDVIQMVRDAGRPVVLGFSWSKAARQRRQLGALSPTSRAKAKKLLEEKEAARRRALEAKAGEEAGEARRRGGSAAEDTEDDVDRVEFPPGGALGILFKRELRSANGRTLVKGFTQEKGAAELSKRIKPGHVLTHVDGAKVQGIDDANAKLLAAMERAGDTITLSFRDMDSYQMCQQG
jgi:hypothetical protein